VQAASKIPEDRASIHTGPGKNSTWQRRLTLLAMCIAQGMILLDVTIVRLPALLRVADRGVFLPHAALPGR